ncbi:DUF4158 domain-containing protein [Arthrobacter methylotrophus]|uniref:DUF4158 domain-containing protein n=1 Tax=Arthrobacter methylotrophus TaxID=121291 RepID=A0ABV5UU02_9MICC
MCVDVEVKVLDREAMFPQDLSDFPADAVDYVASQVKTEVSVLVDYEWTDRISRPHRAQIRSVFGLARVELREDTESVHHEPRCRCTQRATESMKARTDAAVPRSRPWSASGQSADHHRSQRVESYLCMVQICHR